MIDINSAVLAFAFDAFLVALSDEMSPSSMNHIVFNSVQPITRWLIIDWFGVIWAVKSARITSELLYIDLTAEMNSSSFMLLNEPIDRIESGDSLVAAVGRRLISLGNYWFEVVKIFRQVRSIDRSEHRWDYSSFWTENLVYFTSRLLDITFNCNFFSCTRLIKKKDIHLAWINWIEFMKLASDLSALLDADAVLIAMWAGGTGRRRRRHGIIAFSGVANCVCSGRCSFVSIAQFSCALIDSIHWSNHPLIHPNIDSASSVAH